MRTFRIPLRAVFYREDDIWFAHSLEMDLTGDGATRDEALRQLTQAITLQIGASLEHKNMANLFQPADAKFFEMFAAGKEIAVGLLAFQKMQADGVSIDEFSAREYEAADEEDLVSI